MVKRMDDPGLIFFGANNIYRRPDILTKITSFDPGSILGPNEDLSWLLWYKSAEIRPDRTFLTGYHGRFLPDE